MDKLYGGIDLHANNSLVIVLNEQDQVVLQKRVPNELEQILHGLTPFRAQLQGLVVESTYNWYWLVDGLMEAGYHVHLANPAAMQQYAGLKYTNDDTDARWLAHLLRLELLPTGYIYPKEGAGRARPAPEAEPTGSPEDGESLEYSKFTDSEYGTGPAGQSDQTADSRDRYPSPSSWGSPIRTTPCYRTRTGPWGSPSDAPSGAAGS